MTRCIASCRNGKRCRKNAVANKLCWVHCEVECLLCKGGCPVKVRKTLRNCGHSFCKNCIARDFYDFQWFDGFSTENPIRCPECDLEVCDQDYGFITNMLCESKVLQRKIVCDTYFCPETYNELHSHIVLGEEYDPKGIEAITGFWNRQHNTYRRRLPFNNTSADIVYFQKYTGLFNWREMGMMNAQHTYYRFFYGTPEIRNLFPQLQKELVEYVFHPSRVDLENLESM